jgi:nucleoside-diphosphate-sugar epimerase
MKILVTGASGFLGGYIVAGLSKVGHEIIGYDRQHPSREMLAVAPELAERLHIGEIGDFAGLLQMCEEHKVEAIVHAAGLVGFERSLSEPRQYYETNVMGFVNICEAARLLKLKKIVLISSNSVYHRGRGAQLSEADLPFSTTRATPAAHYGTSKMACEAIGMVYSEFHNVDFYSLRVTAIYGFGMRVPIQIKPMVEDAVRGRPTRFETGGPMRRDYTHVSDCADAVVLAMDRPPAPIGAERIFNISPGKTKTGFELAEIVRGAIPGADIEIGPQLSPLEQENIKMRAPLDCSLARTTLGWAPKWTIEDGVRQYARRFQEFSKGMSEQDLAPGR